MHTCYSLDALWGLFLRYGEQVVTAKWFILTTQTEIFFCTGGILG